MDYNSIPSTTGFVTTGGTSLGQNSTCYCNCYPCTCTSTTWTTPILYAGCQRNSHVFVCDHALTCRCGKVTRVAPPGCPTCGQ